MTPFFKYSFSVLLLPLILLLAAIARSLYPQAYGTAEYFKKAGDEARIQRQTLQALDNYRKSLQKNPAYTPALVAYGQLLYETGAVIPALANIQRAVAIEPDNKEAILTYCDLLLEFNQLPQVKELIDRQLNSTPFDPDFNFFSARLLLLEGRHYLAREKLLKILKSNPGHYRSHLLLGELYLNEKRYDKSEKHFRQAQLIKPEDPAIFILLGENALRKITDRTGSLLFDEPLQPEIFEDALGQYLNAKSYDNFHVPANLALGQIYALTGRCREAIAFFDAVLHINPEHTGARYYRGYCSKDYAATEYPAMLKLYENNDILRHSYERNLLAAQPRRENPEIVAQASEHLRLAKNLAARNQINKALYEMRMAVNLFPAFIEAREQLLEHYRAQGDFTFYEQELNYLRTATKRQLYTDTYELYINERRKKLYYKEGFPDPLSLASRTPVYVFHFLPQDVRTPYPDAGRNLAEAIRFALERRGRIASLPRNILKEVQDKLDKKNYFGDGGYYNAEVAETVRELVTARLQQDNQDRPWLNRPLRYALAGDYGIIHDGIRYRARLLDLVTGLSVAEISGTHTGRGYLRDAALALAQFVENKTPFHGHIIKIGRNGIVVNLGKRDGIKRGDVLIVERQGQLLKELKVTQMDHDILWADVALTKDLALLQVGDSVRLKL